MKLLDYLMDKWLLLAALLFFNLYVAFLFYYFYVPLSISVSYFILWALFVASALGLDYWKRRKFYGQVEKYLDNLDEKYLIVEMLKAPAFSEGASFVRALQPINKSMLERINKFSLAQNDYQDYIERWIHEIKTPLAAARLFIENDPRETTKGIGSELDLVDDYLNQALFYARSSHVEKDFLIRPQSLRGLVQKVLKKNVRLFSQKRIVLDIESLEGVVYTDAKWLLFILDQILGNAIKYLGKQPKIKIFTTLKSQQLILTVEDNGIGIPAGDLGRVFDKGFTGENGRIFGKSTGIGLYLCQKMATQLEIAIQIQSHVGTGTKVHLIFPVTDLYFKG